jgi:serine/threonine protein kinase
VSRPLPDATVRHLRDVADWPDTRGTKYRVLECLGRGGMGAVYAAVDTTLEREVALKVLHGMVQDPAAVARLQREARILAQLEHPGIVPVHEVGSLSDGRVYYVMQRVHGERLDRLIARGAPRADRLRIFARVCETVGFAHARGVLHRDLKPENIMVGSFGAVLVMDWGIAKHVESPEDGGAAAPIGAATGTHTMPGTVLGTPAYMAPEQRQGRVEALDVRTDVYALGALLHFLLSGKSPGANSSGDSLPRPLAAVCAKACAVSPSDRYPSVESLAADVDRFAAYLPVGAWREGPLGWIARTARRHRFALAIVAAYLVVRVVLFFFVGS